MQGIKEAKKRLISNVGTNLLLVFVNSVIAIWLTPYLIRNLGVEVYGLIPLALSFTTFFAVFSNSIANAVSRFVMIHLGKGEIEQGQTYFNSSLKMLIVLCGILLVPGAVVAMFFANFFDVPLGFETDVSWLVVYVIVSFFITAVTSPFIVSTFIRHRFDLANGVRMFGQLLRVVVLIVLFRFITPSLKNFGLSYCSMSLFVLVCFIFLTRVLSPDLKVQLKQSSWTAMREMGRMSTWITVNQTGIFLYLGTSLIIVNVLLGAEQGGRYAPIAQWFTLLGVLAGAVSNVFIPIAYEYIAQDRIDVLVVQICRSVKFMGLIMAFPIGILCGLAEPILTRWLGHEFSDLSSLASLLVGPLVVTSSIRPVVSIFRGLNKVKVPAIVTLGIGLANIILSILLIRYTELGIYGIGWSLLICFAGRNLIFTPVYAAKVINQPGATFVMEVIPGLLMMVILSLCGLGLSWKYDLASVGGLLIAIAVIFSVYSFLCFLIFLSKNDKLFLKSLILNRILSS